MSIPDRANFLFKGSVGKNLKFLSQKPSIEFTSIFAMPIIIAWRNATAAGKSTLTRALNMTSYKTEIMLQNACNPPPESLAMIIVMRPPLATAALPY